jgi:hypothetical protein
VEAHVSRAVDSRDLHVVTQAMSVGSICTVHSIEVKRDCDRGVRSGASGSGGAAL